MARPRLSDLIPIALALLLFGAFGVHARASDLVGHVYMQTNETQNRIMHRSEEHTSELQSLMRISYAVFCLKKKKTQHLNITETHDKHVSTDTNTRRNKYIKSNSNEH